MAGILPTTGRVAAGTWTAMGYGGGSGGEGARGIGWLRPREPSPGVGGPAGGPAPPRPSAGEGEGFIEYLRAQVREVERLGTAADRAARDLVVGRSGDIHGTMIALEKADLSFRLLTRVRNKALEAYQEIMRMNV